MNKIKSQISNSVLYIAHKLVLLFFPLLIFSYINNLFGPANMGLISFSSTFISYFVVISSFGGSMYAIKILSKVKNNYELVNKYFSMFFLLRIFTAFLSIILLVTLLLSYQLILNEYLLYIIIFSLSLLYSIFDFEFLAISKDKYSFLFLKSLFVQLLKYIVILAFVRTESQLINYVVIFVIFEFLTNLFYLIKFRNRIKLGFHLFTDLKIHFPFIILHFLLALVALLGRQVAYIFLGLNLGNFELGLYNFGFKIFNLFDQVLIALSTYIFSQMMFYSSKYNNSDFSKLLINVGQITFLLILPIIGVFILASPLIILLIGSNIFLSTENLLILFSISIIFSSYNRILGHYELLSKDKEWIFLIFTSISVIVNIAALFFLMPNFGILSGAIAFLLSEIVMSILLVVYRPSMRINISLILTVLKYTFFALLSLTITTLMNFDFFNLFFTTLFKTIFFSTIYLLLIFIFGDYEKKILNGIISRIKNLNS